MKKILLILFAGTFSVNLIGSSTISLNKTTKDLSHYINLGIKSIAYPFVQQWNSTRSTKAFLTISTIGGLLFIKHIKNSNAQLKKEADFLSKYENNLNKQAQIIQKNIETISTFEKNQQENLINDTADAINQLQRMNNNLNSKDFFEWLSTNNKIKLMTLINSTQTNIFNLNNKLDEIKKKLNIKQIVFKKVDRSYICGIKIKCIRIC